MTERSKPPVPGKTAAAVLAALLAVLALASAAPAQDLRNDEFGNSFGPELPRLGAHTVTAEFLDRVCPQAASKITLSRPVETGDDLLDELFGIQNRMEARRLEREPSFYSDSSECPDGPEESELSRTFMARSAKPGALAVLFTVHVDGSTMAHPSAYYESLNWSFELGAELSAHVLFGGGYYQAAPALWKEVAKGWCAYNEYSSLPSFYGFPDDFDGCGDPGAIPMAPKIEQAESGDLAAWGHAIVTPEGLLLSLGAYEGWSYADGASELLIPKAFFKSIGAGAFWDR
jgi:hypothetical protein